MRGDTLQLGIGVASYVEITAGGGSGEYGKLEIHADGSATMYCGTLSHGQGHQTAYAMLVSAQTGIPRNGNTKPDSSMFGKKNIIDIWMAWSWFCVTVEMVKPSARLAVMNSAVPRQNSVKLPFTV